MRPRLRVEIRANGLPPSLMEELFRNIQGWIKEKIPEEVSLALIKHLEEEE